MASPQEPSLRPVPATMKAQQWHSKDRKIHLNEIPVPEPRPNEVLVQTVCTSMCHSDCMVYDIDYSDIPVTMGHEATGLVVKSGSDVSGFKEGDRVGFLCCTDACFECDGCKTWTNMWCKKGCKIQGFQRDGYFQEYCVVDGRNTFIIPDNYDIYSAAPLFCGGVTAYHAVEECELKPGQWMVIVGAGGLGQMAVQYAKAMGIKIIAIDINDDPLLEAKRLGADHVFNSKTESGYVDKILEITGEGAAAAVNFTASKPSYDSMPPMIRPVTGILMVVGVPHEPLTFDAFSIIFRRFIIKGACIGTCYNFKPCLEFSAKHNIKPSIEFFGLEDMPKMMETMKEGKLKGRQAVRF